MVWHHGSDYVTVHVICGSEDEYEYHYLLGCDAVQFGTQVLTLPVSDLIILITLTFFGALYSSTIKMESNGSSESRLNTYQTTRRHILNDSNLSPGTSVVRM